MFSTFKTIENISTLRIFDLKKCKNVYDWYWYFFQVPPLTKLVEQAIIYSKEIKHKSSRPIQLPITSLKKEPSQQKVEKESMFATKKQKKN